jgi:Tol biopolymer transport system component
MDLIQGFKSARPLVKDENFNTWPGWSPDSQWVSFMSGRKVTQGNILTDQIYKVRVSDGTVVQLTHFPNETAISDSTSWSQEGQIAFVYNDGIYAVRDSGGEAEQLVDLTQRLSPGSLWGAVWSPDGSRLAFRGIPPGSGEADKRIWVADSKGKQVIQVTKDFTDDVPSWLDNDHILFERWGSAGEVRICVVCLHTLRVGHLTRDHIDQTPAADRTGHTLFFARAKLSEENIRAWLPQTHIWAVPINRGRVEHP